MRLENNIYRIESRNDSVYSLSLLPESPIYKAHFPGMPITPGVCIIQMVKELAEDYLGKVLEIETVRNVKFLTVLVPQDKPCVVIDKASQQDDAYAIQARVFSGENTFATVSLTCYVCRNERSSGM